MGKYLVTTAIEKIWPKPYSEVVYLGEWCKLYDRTKFHNKFNSITLPYHWNDRNKYYNDYKYTINLYDEILVELSFELNKIHNSSFSNKYWEILIGFWLGYFIQITFDRWFMLNVAFEKYNKLNYIILSQDLYNYVPNDTYDFVNRPFTDEYNESLYSQIVNLCFSDYVSIETVGFSDQTVNSSKRNVMNTPNYINLLLNRITDTVNKEFFIRTSLPAIENIKLQISSCQIPCIRQSRPLPSYKISANIRRTFYRNWRKQTDEFANLIRVLISTNIPCAFLEGFKDTLRFIEKYGWKCSPNNIFTSTSQCDDDFFKFWAASKVEMGAKINILQHGGHYGTGKFSFFDFYDHKISNTFYSWGYTKKGKKSIKALGNIKTFKTNVNYDKKGSCLLVLMDLSRYSYMLYSTPVSSCQINDYINEQILFLDNLILSIRKQINIILHRINFLNCHQEKLLSKHNDLTFDKNLDIKNSIKKCRLYISTYNATTYLESLYWNIPTICYWNPEYWEINDESKALFEILISVGILYHDPVKAAHKINQVWDNVDAWWQSDELQNARKLFCNKYSKKIKSIRELKINLDL